MTVKQHMEMDPEKYMAERVDDQIEWHDRKSGYNKVKYQRYQLIQLVVASLITLSAVLNTLKNADWVPFVAPTLGAVVAIVSGILGLFKFQENWVDYRMTSEQLRKEKYLFLTQSEPYNEPDSFRLFVATIEDILSKQNSKWLKNRTEGAQAAVAAVASSDEDEPAAE